MLPAETISNHAIHWFHYPSASSVLQNNGKLYGAINALEDSDYKCWNSDSGDSQFYVIKFGRPVVVLQLKLQFQAGFSSEIIKMQVPSPGDGNWDTVDELEPRDTLGLQVFLLDEPTECRELRLDFVDFKTSTEGSLCTGYKHGATKSTKTFDSFGRRRAQTCDKTA